MGGAGREHRRPIGAQAGGIGGILLVGTFHDDAVFQAYGRSDVEFGVRSIGGFLGFDGCGHQRLVLRVHLRSGGIFLIDDVQSYRVHCLWSLSFRG